MTSHQPDRRDELRDPLVDAAWRTASRDEPPSALDDAIRAAARREAGAGPMRATADVPEATSPERWWWPLAAAATIGAIALGIIQVIGTSPTETQRPDRAVVSDVPSALTERATTGPGPTPAADAVGTAKPTAAPEPAPTRVERASEAPILGTAKRTQPTAVPQTAAAPQAPVPGPPPSASPVPVDTAPAVAMPPRDRAAPEAAPALRSPAPFPGAPAAREERSETLRDADAAADAMAKARRDEATAQGQGAMRRAAPASAKASVESQSQSGASAEAQPRLPVSEWVVLIRRLRDEGRIDEAAKELAAFRAAYPDHERQLPPDLRDWKPASAR